MELEKIVVLKLNDNIKNPVLPKELADEVQDRIGSEFRKGTRDCIRGLSPIQERILLPDIIGVSADSVDYAKKCRDFWADFGIAPSAEGMRLNIATETKSVATKDGSKEEVEVPVNLEDYMVYTFALQSSRVAITKDQRESNVYPFSLVDLSEEQKVKKDQFEAKKLSLRNFAKLVVKDDEEATNKINWVIRALKSRDEYFNFNSSRQDKEMYLHAKMENSPSEFSKVVNDPDLETKALLYRAIELGEISLQGSNYFLGTINIGTEISAVDYLKSPTNSGDVVALISRLEHVELIQK